MSRAIRLPLLLALVLLAAACGSSGGSGHAASATAPVAATTSSTPTTTAPSSSSSTSSSSAPSTLRRVEACSLLRVAEIARIAGARPRRPRGARGPLDTSTCTWTGGVAGGRVGDSVVLSVANRPVSAGRVATQAARGRPVPGVGDRAAWSSSVSALFALKGQRFITVAIVRGDLRPEPAPGRLAAPARLALARV